MTRSRTIDTLIHVLEYLLWLLLDPSKFTIPRASRIKNVLIVHDGVFGELLVSTPLARALKESCCATVTMMIPRGREEVFRGNPCIDGVLFFPDSYADTLATLRRHKFDTAILLCPRSLMMAFACLRAGVAYRVGCFKFCQKGPALFYTRRWWPPKERNQHAIQSGLDMLRLLGINPKDPKIEFYFTKQDEDAVEALLAASNTGPFCLVHPGFGGPRKCKAWSRQWPSDVYARVCDHVIEKHGLSVVVSGIQEEHEFATAVRDRLRNRDRITLLTGRLDTLQKLGALVKRAELLVAPDTAIVHIAAALQTKTVDLLGDDTPVRWHPWMPEKNYRLVFHPCFVKGDLSDEEKVRLQEAEIRRAIDELLADASGAAPRSAQLLH